MDQYKQPVRQKNYEKFWVIVLTPPLYRIKHKKNTVTERTLFAGIKDLGVYIKEADLVTTPADEVYLLRTLTTTRLPSSRSVLCRQNLLFAHTLIPCSCILLAWAKIEMKNSRIRRRVHELLSKAVTPGSAPVASQRELHFVFFRKPDRFVESDDRSGHVGAIRLEKTALRGNTVHIVLRNLYSLFHHL